MKYALDWLTATYLETPGLLIGIGVTFILALGLAVALNQHLKKK